MQQLARELDKLLTDLSTYLKELSEERSFIIASEERSLFFRRKTITSPPKNESLPQAVKHSRTVLVPKPTMPAVIQKDLPKQKPIESPQTSRKAPSESMNNTMKAMVEKALPSLAVIDKIPDFDTYTKKPKIEQNLALVICDHEELLPSFMSLQAAVQKHFGACGLIRTNADNWIYSLSKEPIPPVVICSNDITKLFSANSIPIQTTIVIHSGTFDSKDLKKDLWQRISLQMSSK